MKKNMERMLVLEAVFCAHFNFEQAQTFKNACLASDVYLWYKMTNQNLLAGIQKI